MILAAWAVNPLQNAILNNDIVALPRVVPLKRSDVTLSSRNPGTNFLNTAYATLWLGQEMPQFSTPKYALTRFHTDDTDFIPSANQTLSANTTMYFTELVCKPPSQVSIDHSSGNITFEDGEGCTAANVISFPDVEKNGQYAPYYIGYPDAPFVDASLEQAGCGPEAAHKFLAIWKVASNAPPDFSDPANATALFCEPSYYMQQVKATISVPDNIVITTVPSEPKVPLPAGLFNTTLFEFLLTNGALPSFNSSDRQDIIESTVLEQDPRLQNMSLSYQGFVGSMVGFAIGSTHFSPEAYLEPDTLAAAYQAAHQLLFATAMESLLNPAQVPASDTGTLVSTVQAVSVVPAFAWLAVACLVLIFGVTCYLGFVTSRRPSKLVRDPDCLGEIMKLSCDGDVQQLFSAHDVSNGSQLVGALTKYNLDLQDSTGRANQSPVLRLSSCSRPIARCKVEEERQCLRNQASARWSVQPAEYRLWVGFLVCLSLAGLIFGLVILRSKSRTSNGR